MVEESKPAASNFFLVFWMRAFLVYTFVHPFPCRCVRTSKKSCSSCKGIISARPLLFQNVGSVFTSLISFVRLFSCTRLIGSLPSSIIFCFTRVMYGRGGAVDFVHTQKHSRSQPPPGYILDVHSNAVGARSCRTLPVSFCPTFCREARGWRSAAAALLEVQ